MYKSIFESDSINKIDEKGNVLETIPNNQTLGAWAEYQDWLAAGNTPLPADPEPTPPPTPEWLKFNTTLLTDSDWLATADLLLEGLKIALYSNASSGNTDALQTNLAVSLEYLNSINKPVSQTVLNKWQNLANLHHIPITFTQHANLQK